MNTAGTVDFHGQLFAATQQRVAAKRLPGAFGKIAINSGHSPAIVADVAT
jgi:hypothetical protein